jgi:hypothetical protein
MASEPITGVCKRELGEALEGGCTDITAYALVLHVISM